MLEKLRNILVFRKYISITQCFADLYHIKIDKEDRISVAFCIFMMFYILLRLGGGNFLSNFVKDNHRRIK